VSAFFWLVIPQRSGGICCYFFVVILERSAKSAFAFAVAVVCPLPPATTRRVPHPSRTLRRVGSDTLNQAKLSPLIYLSGLA
jgi:hypothetical protein